jgi:hypothetical protein
MEFEDIQKSWQTQRIEVRPHHTVLEANKNRWERNQQKLLKSNVWMSLGFVVAMVAIGWVYFAFYEQYGLPFKVSIGCMYMLMIIFLVVSWRSYNFGKGNMDDSSQEYIQQQIKKLSWQKNVIKRYTVIYVILLWLALLMYIWEITITATPTFRFTAFGLTTLYLFGITMWNRVKKQKKQLAEINLLISSLEDIKGSLNKA